MVQLPVRGVSVKCLITFQPLSLYMLIKLQHLDHSIYISSKLKLSDYIKFKIYIGKLCFLTTGRKQNVRPPLGCAREPYIKFTDPFPYIMYNENEILLG